MWNINVNATVAAIASGKANLDPIYDDGVGEPHEAEQVAEATKVLVKLAGTGVLGSHRIVGSISGHATEDHVVAKGVTEPDFAEPNATRYPSVAFNLAGRN